jgi:hypothetical protein
MESGKHTYLLPVQYLPPNPKQRRRVGKKKQKGQAQQRQRVGKKKQKGQAQCWRGSRALTESPKLTYKRPLLSSALKTP